MDKLLEKIRREKTSNKHYYGDIVRVLFLTVAGVMLLTLPFFYDRTPISIFVSIFVILAISVFAGITNPAQKNTAIINTGVSIIGLAVFEYYAVKVYTLESFSAFFATNQLLAFIFLFALYYSTKTLRGIFISDN